MGGMPMRNPWTHFGYALVMALVFVLAPVRSHAGEDVRVWVNTNSGVYHCPGGRYYGATKRGKYLTESSAVASGYRAAYGNACSADVVRETKQQVIHSLAPAGTGATTKVWINTGSHVYHCPGSRHYGATRRGHYATEEDAISDGNRPAYGQRCGQGP